MCSNVLLSVIPWWGCSQSLLGSGWMGLIHSLPAAHCAAFCRHFALYTCLSSCWHLSFCRPAPLLPAWGKASTTVTVHCSILDVGVSQVCLATLVSVEDWNKNERWVYSIGKKQFVLCLLLSLPWVRGTNPGEPHRQTETETETDTQDRQAEGLLKRFSGNEHTVAPE